MRHVVWLAVPLLNIYISLSYTAQFPNSQQYKSISRITNTHMKRAWRFFSMGKPTHRIIFFSFEISFSHNEKSSHSTLKMKKKRQKKMLVLRTKLAIWRLEVSLNVYNNEKENQKKLTKTTNLWDIYAPIFSHHQCRQKRWMMNSFKCLIWRIRCDARLYFAIYGYYQWK